MEPTVQAYAGSLSQAERGIEFTTATPPHPNGSPFEARWYLRRTPGVVRRWDGVDEFACVLANVKPNFCTGGLLAAGSPRKSLGVRWRS